MYYLKIGLWFFATWLFVMACLGCGQENASKVTEQQEQAKEFCDTLPGIPDGFMLRVCIDTCCTWDRGRETDTHVCVDYLERCCDGEIQGWSIDGHGNCRVK